MKLCVYLSMNDLGSYGAGDKIRLWDFIGFSDKWKLADTSLLDDISPSWFGRRKVLEKNSSEYAEFIARLKREHAIETGVIERLYDLKKGITETFIKEGFVQSYLSHGDTNIPESQLMDHLQDHLDAVDFIFDVVKHNRSLSTGFIKELHALVTAHQEFAEGRDQFGTRLKVALLKGEYKQRENNPTTDKGVILYCPPEHVAAEMDQLVNIYNTLDREQVHPLIIAAWFHHAFSIIHPFQDGNGRVARLLTSLIFIKAKLFPFTVPREEAKVKYIGALVQADEGEPQALVSYFAEVQRRHIEQALNLREFAFSSLDEAAKHLSEKLKTQHDQAEITYKKYADQRREVYHYCLEYLENAKISLRATFEETAGFRIESRQYFSLGEAIYYVEGISHYARQNNYHFNQSLPSAYIKFTMQTINGNNYSLVLALHHYGYVDSTLAIGPLLFHADKKYNRETLLSLTIKPLILSLEGSHDKEIRKSRINSYLNDVLTLTLAQISEELP